MTIRVKETLSNLRSNFTPTSGALFVTDVSSTNPKLYIGDGITPGGKLLADPKDNAQLDLKVLTADAGLQPSDRVGLDTTNGPITVTLPSAPAIDDTVYVTDVGGSMFSNPAVVGRNGNSIMGLSQSLKININNFGFHLPWTGSTWRVH